MMLLSALYPLSCLYPSLGSPSFAESFLAQTPYYTLWCIFTFKYILCVFTFYVIVVILCFNACSNLKLILNICSFKVHLN